jgi:hypothetical protein
MDRSFLSRPEVIAASRHFVCVRLATYENKEEAALLKAFDVTRSGELENTVFCVLSSDGKRRLTRAGRSTRRLFDDAQRMGEDLERIARANTGVKQPEGSPALPKVAGVRLAVNVAACDNQPLVVLHCPKKADLPSLEARVAALAWSKAFLGRFLYATTSDAKDLKEVSGVPARGGLLVIQSSRYGERGQVLAHAGPSASAEELEAALRQGVRRFEAVEKTFRQHVREGQQQGVFWETVVPVTDPMELRARERGRKAGRP